MNGRWRTRMSGVVMDWSTALLPRRREAWKDAMRGEMEVLTDPDAKLTFALGCLAACWKEGEMTTNFALRLARVALAASLLILALFTGRAAARAFAVDHPAHPAVLVLAGLTLLYVASAVLWWWAGIRTFVRFGGAILTVAIVAFLYLRFGLTASQWEGAWLLRALVLEGIFIWVLLAAGGAVLSIRRTNGQT